MKIVNVLAGFSLGKADTLRRAISKKKEEVMQEVRNDFVQGCLAHQIDKRIADKIFNFIVHFAGYGFNKSHSAAYAMISYQTAYLKANYPVEFMTALLSSEKDNTDKVVLYIDEAKHMGLKVLPPDVNESFPQFTVVAADTIRFGLAAVKNVGQTAIDAIIQGRIKRNRFKSFFDLTEHVDLRVVNRKVLESLIKCGAFDSTGVFRSRLYEVLEQTLAQSGEIQKDRESGQMSFFDSLGAEAAFEKGARRLPEIPEWKDEVLLANEKEMLGFYVTGHPLDRFKKELKSYSSTTTATAVMRRDGEEVLMGGLVNKLKITQTKKTNEKMAIVGFQDLEGAIDALIFPRAFKEFGQHLVKDAVLFFRGNIDKKEGTPKLLVNQIIPIQETRKRFTRSVLVRIRSADGQEDRLKSLQEILNKHPGSIPVYLEFIDKDNNRSQMLVDRSLFVEPSDNLVSSLEETLGNEAVWFRM
jgi:DNA polymerase-3 subunit alpha